ncbi:MAG: pyridoxal phosphate-dependent aminotransferase [Myxococcales bacterium]
MRRHLPPDVNLNLNVRDLTVSATLALQELSNKLRADGRQVFRLGLGQSPFPVPRSVVEALQVNAWQKDYLPVRGLPALREAIADYHRRRNQLPCSADDVLVGPGSKELMFILQLVYYGDLLIPSPGWVSYAPQAQIVGRHVHWVHTRAADDWKMTPDELEEICAADPERPRVVVFNYPNNPTGCTYTADELKAIARVARAHRVIALSDEIYGELHFRGQHVSISRYYPEGTIISGGLSKWCGAGGWRLGAFTFPKELRWLLDKAAVVASETYTSTSAPIQFAAVRAFRGGMDIESYLWQSRRVLRSLARHVVARLEKAGAQVAHPHGAFYAFPDFSPLREKLAARGIRDSVELCKRLLEETGVAALPGKDFGRPATELTMRIAFVDFDGARALSAAEHLPKEEPIDDEFLHAHCGNITLAMERLGEWLAEK